MFGEIGCVSVYASFLSFETRRWEARRRSQIINQVVIFFWLFDWCNTLMRDLFCFCSFVRLFSMPYFIQFHIQFSFTAWSCRNRIKAKKIHLHFYCIVCSSHSYTFPDNQIVSIALTYSNNKVCGVNTWERNEFMCKTGLFLYFSMLCRFSFRICTRTSLIFVHIYLFWLFNTGYIYGFSARIGFVSCCWYPQMPLFP